MNDIQLSPHFKLSEFTKSNTATRLGIDNTPEQWHIDNMIDLCKYVLEPVRLHFKKPVRVNSGYRSPELCQAIGSSPRSNHTIGAAADIEIYGVPNIKIFEFIAKHLNFKELIAEYFGPNPNDGWVHVAYQNGYNTKQIKLKDKNHNYTVVSADYILTYYGDIV